MSKWLLSLSFLALAGSAGVTFVDRVETRLGQLEGRGQVEPSRVARLTRQVAALRDQLVASEAQLRCVEDERRERQALEGHVDLLQTQLSEAQLTPCCNCHVVQP